MNWWLIIAAILSVFTWAVHIFVGGRVIAKPLLKTDLKDVPKYTNYYCWHIVSIVLTVMPVGFLLGAIDASARDLAMMMTVLALAFSVWSLTLIVWKRQSPIRLPQWGLFLPIAVFGFLGLWL